MRTIYSIDANQPDIVLQLEQTGASVESLAAVGGGVPDLLVGCAGVTVVSRFVTVADIARRLAGLGPVTVLGGCNLLIEVKTEAGKLRESQIDWHNKWRGQVAVCRTVGEALRLAGVEL